METFPLAIEVWTTWSMEWKFLPGPCSVVRLREQLHPEDAMAVDVYYFQDEDEADPMRLSRLYAPDENPRPGYCIILPGVRLWAHLSRGDPVQRGGSQAHWPDDVDLY